MKKAFSLSITIWISLSLIAGAVYFIQSNKKTVSTYSKLLDKLEASNNLLSDTSKLKFYISTGQFQSNTIKNELLHNYLSLPKEMRIDGESFALGKSNFKLQDTAGLINMFFPEEKKLEALLTSIGRENTNLFTSSLSDWIDKNSLYRLNGAEEDYYKSFGYTPRNRNYIQHFHELDLVKEWKDDANSSLSNYFCYSNSSGTNITTMPFWLIKNYYRVSQNDIDSLYTLKEKNIEEFFFYFLRIPDKYNFDAMYHDNIPSRSLVIEANTTINNSTFSNKETINYLQFENILKNF